MPEYPVKLICEYLGRRPERTVDLGSGTGLSSLVWKEHCDRVIGVEPSGEMLAEARKKKGETFRSVRASATGPGWTQSVPMP